MKAYKFLDGQSRGRFSQRTWSLPNGAQPGAWMHIEGAPEPCVRGFHAMRTKHLPFWLDQQLWEAELAGACVETESLLVAERARLVRRVDAWNEDAWTALGAFCRERTEALVRRVAERDSARLERAQLYAREIDDFVAQQAFATAVYVAAVAAHVGSDQEPEAAYQNERAEQARFLKERLGLSD
jgi:hypothetical protein